MVKAATQIVEFCKKAKEVIANCWAFVVLVATLVYGGTVAVVLTVGKLVTKLCDMLWREIRTGLHDWRELISLENEKALRVMRNMVQQAERIRRMLSQCRRGLSQLAWVRT